MKANTKEKKPVFKQPVSNPVRIAKKKLRKELKKELRSKNKGVGLFMRIYWFGVSARNFLADFFSNLPSKCMNSDK